MSVPTTVVSIGAIFDDFGLLQASLAAGARSDDATPTISGTLSATLLAGESVEVYGNGSLLGAATVNGQTFSAQPTMTNGQRLKVLRWVVACLDNGSPVSSTQLTTF